MRCIAVDWSGARDEGPQLASIWIAIAEEGSLSRLRNGLTREEAGDELVKNMGSHVKTVVGIDFAFSFPIWFCQTLGISQIESLWALVKEQGNLWLEDKPEPFWDGQKALKSKKLNENPSCEFRQTDLEIAALKRKGVNPKSVFKLIGPGQVGRGSVRGQPTLLKLRVAGATVWPFHPLETEGPIVVEIYPRMFYGDRVTNNSSVAGRDSRRDYLYAEFPELEQHWRDIMVGNENAFDAGVSALVMSKHAGEFRNLKSTLQPPMSLEGEIWRPGAVAPPPSPQT